MQDAPLAVTVGRPDVDPQQTDLLLAGLILLAQFHGVTADAAQLLHEFGCDAALDEQSLLLAAKSLGLKARFVHQSVARLPRTPLPALMLQEDGRHFILARLDETSALIHDLHERRPRSIPIADFADGYSGRMLLMSLANGRGGARGTFDFRWFIPSVVKYRRLFIEVIIVSAFIQLAALVTPLLFQVVMDKVLVHRSLTTLNVIVFAVGAVAFFEIILGGLRTHVLAHTTSKIDVELGAGLFRHVLALPLAYFETRRVGDTVARVREIENIRNFLTGQALTSLLDLCFTVVFLAVMLNYSGWLTIVVVASIPAYALWSASITPALRRLLDEKFARGADNQSFLVETIGGMGTVKAAAIDPQITRTWDGQLAGYVAAGMKVVRVANIGQQGVQFIQKTVSVVLLYLGARLVIEGELTVGQLIAFNMLSGQVAAPVVRLAQLWQDFQQVGISVQRLGDILNTPTERAGSRVVPPSMKGAVRFERTTFRYRPDGAEVIAAIDLDIEAGKVIGVVGRSGSGKSTLTKLIQRLYVPERGRVLVDGHDLALVDPAWLRRQLGVVLQENFLFNRSIRENIALSEQGASMAKVIHAARLSGAHDFILELPEGYDTQVGERGSALSGGQRQRIAIARANDRSPHPDPGRSDQCARLRVRACCYGEHASDMSGTDRDHHCPSPLHRARYGPNYRPRQGAHRRGRVAR